MAHAKQTARKNTGGKPLAMGRGKDPAPKPKPKLGRVDRKVIIEYSSDEFDEENPQPVEGTGAPKRVVKQIHLTLPTSPAHVTTTESFKTFFINHGLTRALRNAFENRGWSTDQMQELMTNFKNKYGQMIPLPKIYQDEDSSDSEGLALEDGTKVGKKATGGAGGSGRGRPGRKPSAGGSGGRPSTSGGGGASTSGSSGASTSGGGGIGGSGGDDPGRGRKRGRDDNGDDDDPNKHRKTGMKADHRGSPWPVKSHTSQAQVTPQLTEICQFSTSLVERRELGWAITYWIGLQRRRERYMRQGCRGGW